MCGRIEEGGGVCERFCFIVVFVETHKLVISDQWNVSKGMPPTMPEVLLILRKLLNKSESSESVHSLIEDIHHY